MLGLPRFNRVTAVVVLLIGTTYVANPVHAADAWTQQGADIDGTVSLEVSGWSVAMSADGMTLAIGAPFNDDDKGALRVFAWDGSNWNQRGNTLLGDADFDYFGGSVAMSADGMTLVVGSNGSNTNTGLARVFTYDASGDQWTQLGSDLNGEAGGDNAGYSVAMSSDGRTVAIGALLNAGNGTESGQVRVFTWNGSAWVQQGADIDGEAANDRAGSSVAMSADGTTVAIGAPLNAGNGTESGQVRVFTWNGSAWVQQGADIDGEAANDRAGSSVAMSADGMTLAIGAPGNSGVASGAGQVRVFTWNGTGWTQQGADLDGEGPSDQFGYSVAMSADGSSIIAGSPTSDVGGVDRGRLRVFVWNGTEWTQRGQTIEGETAGDSAGWSVAMSADGTSIAEGAPLSDDAAALAGQVRVFSWPYTETSAGMPGPPTTFTFLLPDGRECSAISPMVVQVGTMVELPGVEADCRTMPGSTVVGWTIPVPNGFTGFGSSTSPFPPGLRVRVVDSQRFTLVPLEPVIQIDYDANIAASDPCTPANPTATSGDGRIEYVWVPRTDFANARTLTQAPCTPQGHRLTGWNTRGDGLGQTLTPGSPLPESWQASHANQHRLFAQWSPAK